ncbi:MULTISPECIES: glycosyltransferase family 4 protein [unclassified Mesorhizobium]|uniref:glycosyltransferase family 4 protein n=1 Tax=unclassified Mesorhizobium TaxID=325217 RepID=UPI000FCBBBD5|nr:MULTISPECIES: glycosyltransferase family 4 protein [unclassified Mesorhizobium]RUU62994.1 glycosyltransferase [Mesorhizobium sp. M7A.T.Ca.TU.009.01.1.1]RUU77057.1 glycosyltransferase [Mesorhizobium sp. M7A.T.Ca.TU.009.01.1.2]RUT86913.1 glycosyltransferase [Mesorhizobium sp. M7A.T.Ca.US.000.02.1.1]RUT94222.1 glycosyltransferase [Mesorhizobium sp. M7A.T.Ca.US.000.02.2.1]RUU03454.1 glycosyltransferase [Mesorhizobium sp. M7A.T.Ca.TU.009.02.1.1]
MRIAFYAPLKSPNHPVVSGDRQMARMLVKALEHGGHSVELASELRFYLRQPESKSFEALKIEAAEEAARLTKLWGRDGKPDLWFTYHPYYKAPDLIGPELASAFAIPYVTAEASYSRRREAGLWADSQALVARAIEQAAMNICFTQRDRQGLADAIPKAAFGMLSPFIDTSAFREIPARGCPTRLITVAMMRPGDKLGSYRMLAQALGLIGHLPWTMSVVGDGPARDEVEAQFAGLPADRIEWIGSIEPAAVPDVLYTGGIYVWPGYGEAYGVAYLEAQAAGLPVVAQDIAGVPEVVRDGQTGFLTPPGDVAAFASAIERLLARDDERTIMAAEARRFVLEERSLGGAAARLAELIAKVPVS